MALLIAALVVLAAALYLGSRRNSGEPSPEGTRFLPQLASALGTVSEIDLQKGAATPAVTLHRAGEQWTLAQRADYPADASKVHKLLLCLADALAAGFEADGAVGVTVRTAQSRGVFARRLAGAQNECRQKCDRFMHGPLPGCVPRDYTPGSWL